MIGSAGRNAKRSLPFWINDWRKVPLYWASPALALASSWAVSKACCALSLGMEAAMLMPTSIKRLTAIQIPSPVRISLRADQDRASITAKPARA